MRKILLLILLISSSGCSQFALIASGSSLVVSHNVYAKAYSGIDILTIIGTEKDIKTHVYDHLTERNPPAGSGSFSSPERNHLRGSSHPYPPSGCVIERDRNERQ